MDWKKEAVADLRELPFLEEYVRSFNEQLVELEALENSMRGATLSSDPFSGGYGNRQEDKLINVLVKKERLILGLKGKQLKLNRILRALELLDEKEKRVLELFYIDGRRNHIEILREELHAEKSEVYRIKERALRKMTLALYGLTEE